MLYKLAHVVQARMPWIWDVVESVNAAVCGWKLGNKTLFHVCTFLSECLSDDIYESVQFLYAVILELKFAFAVSGYVYFCSCQCH